MLPYSELSIVDLKKILSIILTLTSIADILLGYIAGKTKIEDLRGYISINTEHDFLKTSLFKVLFLFFLSNSLYGYRDGIGYHAEGLIFLYTLFVFIHGAYFFSLHPKRHPHKKKDKTISHRLLEIAIDPFLKKHVDILGSLPNYKLSWNWKSFIFLEFWFLWNEIYGLGMFLLLFYVSVYPIIPGDTFIKLSVWLSVRIFFGFLGDYIYSAKMNGNKTI